MDKHLQELSARLTVADMSSAIAFGLQRAIERHKQVDNSLITNRILRYGGRLDFIIEILPPQVNPQTSESIATLKSE